ncbi:hypothetical protein SLEP1_g21912 [Rubroshorea leprosula]|uniref:RRM domain-containing protein n=1 Tax=Rubroshorea leprosula TaxID=152421 RepID=A0AAV5J7I8_9ROSI|nr:hypothetical protein SLEP1_g21912 [Rubroshorea leprosula]
MRERGRERTRASRGHGESLVRLTSQRSVFGRQTDQVQRRRGDGNIRQEGCRQSFGGYDWKIYNQATAFFFTNFPEEWNYEDLWRLFSKYGRIYSIYSPEKRDRFGRRFGFIRFLEVKDKKELERQLDQIWIGHTKLRENIPRFKEEDRNGKKESKPKIGMQNHPDSRPVNNQIQGGSERRWGSRKVEPHRSYADVLRGSRNTRPMAEHRGNPRTKHSEKPNRREWQKKNNDQEWTGFEFNVKEEDYSWLQGCYVGQAHSVEIVPCIQERFYMEGYFACKLKAMGGKLVLLESEDKDELKDLVENASYWLGQWFKEIKPWSPCMVANERFVWIRCTGVPLHSWGPTFFSTLSCIWGKFITLDESTSKKKRFDIARFLICTPVMDSISKKLKVKINGTVKKALWQELKSLVLGTKGNWCLVGDFNAVKSRQERAGGKGSTTKMREFEDFIRDSNLVDLPLCGRRYTWYQVNGASMSKIDRFLLSEDWLLNWSDCKRWGLGRSISDHYPIILKNILVDWGPRLFKWFDAWLDTPGLRDEIKKVWNSTKVSRWKGYCLKEKFKAVKRFLKAWSMNFKEEVDRNIIEYKAAIASLDAKGEQNNLSTKECVERQRNFVDLWKCLKTKEGMLKQKSRKMWIKNGDANTCYFHRCVKSRIRKKEICCLHMDGQLVDDVQILRQKIVEHYTSFFKDEEWKRPTLDSIAFNRLPPDSAAMLADNFTEEEVKKAVWDCGVTKAPSPDGFNFQFIREMWEVLKEDIMGFIQEFHENGKLVRGLNESFIVLIPKKENPLELEDFRPISLIGAMYKILTKILTNRLSRVMQEIIGEQQTAFVKGRQLMDGVVVANEVIHEVRRKRKSSFVFKIDFEKAFDKVSWKFLDYMLERMGFDSKWRGWIQECLSTSRVSILVNGSTTNQFSVSQGLRQGDPLSLFLFLIIAEGLNGIIASTISKKLFAGVSVAGSYAFQVFRGPYWGQPKKIENLATAGGKFQEEVVTMKGEIRIHGRPNYSDKCYVVKPTRWENVCKSKEEGRLRVKNLRTFNLALMGKWWGRLAKGEGGLWHKVLKAKYGREGVNWTRWMKENSELGSLWWRDVCRLNEIRGSNIGWLERGFELDVGEGKEMLFWKENWVGIGELANLFPRLFLLSTGKENVISQMGKWKNREWTWNLKWRHALREEETIQLQNMISRLNTKSLTKGRRDVWHWKHDQNGIYSASSGYQTLSRSFSSTRGVIFNKIWNPHIPTKVSAFSWLVTQDRIPSKVNLWMRGVLRDVSMIMCKMCEEGDESTRHLFLHCHIANILWGRCCCWWGVEGVLAESCSKAFVQHEGWFKDKRLREGWEVIWFAVIWTIWLARNGKIFNNETVDTDQLFQLIQARSFIWLKERKRGHKFSLSDWLQGPRSSMRNG